VKNTGASRPFNPVQGVSALALPSASQAEPQDILLATGDLATRWHTSVGHLANLRSKGAGPSYVKLGANVLYKLSDVHAYEDECLVRTAA
jgi:hypothetical protein